MFYIKKTKSTGRYEINFFGLKAKFRLAKSDNKLNEKLENLLYELADSRTLANIKLPKVMTCEDSVYALVDSDKSMARYGDGEFKLMMGENISFQKSDSILAKRLIEIIKNNNDKILVGIPDIFGYVNQDYMRRVVITCREMLYKYLSFDKEYSNANCARQFIFSSQAKGKDYFRNFKRIWDNKDIVIVEGEGSRLGVGNDLFDNVLSTERILCPIKDAFGRYDEILSECKKQTESKLFILALGPTATVLADDLTSFGYRALDVGHLDTVYEMFLKKAGKLEAIPGKIVFNEERHKNMIPECKDEDYNKQIIAKITD